MRSVDCAWLQRHPRMTSAERLQSSSPAIHPVAHEPTVGVTVHADAPALTVCFAEPRRSLGWTLLGGGYRLVRSVVFCEVRDTDLPADLDPALVAHRRVEQLGLADAAVFLTSAPVARFGRAQLAHGGVSGGAIATVGLGNAMRVGERPTAASIPDGPPLPPAPGLGTINTLCWIDVPLSFEAQLEAVSVCTQARTSVLRDAAVDTPAGFATGTGTDCIILLCAAHSDRQPLRFAGLHTDVGYIVGASVASAVEQSLRYAVQRRARATSAAPLTDTHGDPGSATNEPREVP